MNGAISCLTPTSPLNRSSLLDLDVLLHDKGNRQTQQPTKEDQGTYLQTEDSEEMTKLSVPLHLKSGLTILDLKQQFQMNMS